jgi:dTDP-4-amino-4,6-dideoxygalactose transaminase
LADLYRRHLDGTPDIVLPVTAPDRVHVFHLFVIRSHDRDALQRHLAEREIATAIHYPIPLHLQAAFAQYGYGAGDFPAAESCAREVLALPLYPEMGDDAVAHVSAAVRDWATAHR